MIAATFARVVASLHPRRAARARIAAIEARLAAQIERYEAAWELALDEQMRLRSSYIDSQC